MYKGDKNMGVTASIVSAVLKSVVGDKIGSGLAKEIADISIDGMSEKGIKEITDFINREKNKIDNILSKENMKSMNIPEDHIDYVIAEIKDLLLEVEITGEVLRQCEYDRMKLSALWWEKYCEHKNDHIECESDIKRGLFAVSEALLKLMYESEGFEKDFLIQISNSVDDTSIEIQRISDYLDKNISKLDTDNQKILNILQNILDESHITGMQENDNSSDKSISMFISYSWNDRNFVDDFDNKLQEYGYEVKRDIRDLDYTKSIKEFMKEIRETDYSIIVLSDSFLKSENCMREIFEFIKDEDFKDRIIPVILESAKDIWGDNKGINYTIFWQKKEREFKEQLQQIDEESKGGYIEDLKHISSVKDSIGEVMRIFRDMKMFNDSGNVADDIVMYIKKKRIINNCILDRENSIYRMNEVEDYITLQPEKVIATGKDINSLNGREFEILCLNLLENMGFSVETTRASGDSGIDLIAYNHEPVLSGKYIIQCKRYSGMVGLSIVRNLYGKVALVRANKGILITTGHFTKCAIDFAEECSIELIDREQLNDLLKKHGM